jgi:SAM-dependent methyltransferase
MFDVAADSYARFMGRFSEPLASKFADLAGVRTAQRALDVGCGPGALTAELVKRLGAGAVDAIDPSPSFVAAARARCPSVDVRIGSAERLPFAAEAFDVTLAQLVVHFRLPAWRRWRGSLGRAAWRPPASGITPVGQGRWLSSGEPFTTWIRALRMNLACPEHAQVT